MEDKELKIVKTALAMPEGMQRRTFLKLASAAGISMAMTPAMTRLAEAADIMRPTLASTSYNRAIDFFRIWEDGFNGANGAFETDPKYYYSEFDISRTLSQIRSMPAAGVKGLAGVITPTGAIPQVSRLCAENDIMFTPTWDTPDWWSPVDEGDHVVSLVTLDSVRDGYEVAKLLFDSIGGEGKVVHIKGLPAPTDTYRTLGLMKAAEEYPGIEIVGGLRADWDRDKARQVMLSMFAAHPDMKAVFAQSDDMAFGVISALRERGMKDVKVAGVVGLPEGIQEVQKGDYFVATATNVPTYMAGLCSTLLFDAINGWKPTLGERMLYVGSVMVTQENAQTMLDKIYGEGDSFDWAKMSRTLNPEDWDPQYEVRSIDPDQLYASAETERKLNPVYDGAAAAGEFSKVDALYAEHYKTGPLKS
ncbi:sugar ABC transporter substrate-binding protein [Celeribacter litoreus]|uniref:sugar ABC transporter substrate-binding protein n=1 Tax=Celeribacter litoreus TaxID=2876714 RepID=UPI001CC92B94|nr:sugar ABC transporter substrate-binding protein [Celeribacter litoreus]MCA0043398.1 sugar ABC transporter substrate-binding protein [Celeribacter litoreus]